MFYYRPVLVGHDIRDVLSGSVKGVFTGGVVSSLPYLQKARAAAVSI